MRILLTTDAAGGVGTFARELGRGLQARGHEVLLARLGPRPLDEETGFGLGAAEVQLAARPFRLEWMAGGTADAEPTQDWLRSLAADFRADVLHCNSFGAVPPRNRTPTVFTAHSDVVSWWRAARGESPPQDEFHDTYATLARAALGRAQAVVAPSNSARMDLRTSYAFAGPIEVIPNGCAAGEGKEDDGERPWSLTPRPWAAAVGRIWDAGKRFGLLERGDLPCSVFLAGPRAEPGGKEPPPATVGRAHLLGPLPLADVRRLLRAADVFISASVYEPFGLAALEAAQSHCALLLSDIPTFREIWGDAARFFAPDDGADLRLQLAELAIRADQRADWAERALFRSRQYTRAGMAAAYERLYCRVAAGVPTSAGAGA